MARNRNRLLSPRDTVPVDGILRQMEEHEMTPSDVAKCCGWETRKKGRVRKGGRNGRRSGTIPPGSQNVFIVPDGNKVSRMLGMSHYYKKSEVDGRRLGPYRNTRIMYDRAVFISRKCGFDLTEVGV